MTEYLCHHRGVPGIVLRLRIRRCMGDTDVELAVLARGSVAFEESDPHLEGMAFSRDGRWLYRQTGRGCDREFCTIDLLTGQAVPGMIHPSSPQSVVLASDFASPSGRLGGVGDGRFGSDPFQLTHPMRTAASGMDDVQRMEALDCVLASPPSPQAWADLAGLFERWTGEASARAAEKACAMLEHWPEQLREKPAWLSWLEPHPLWQIVTKPEQSLCLDTRAVDGATIERLLALPAARRLEILQLSRCGVDDVGAKVIARSPGLAQLRVLDVSGNPIGDEGARALACSPWLGKVESLDLRGSRVSDSMLETLRHSPGLGSLHELHGWEEPVLSRAQTPLVARPVAPVRPAEPHSCSTIVDRALSTGAVDALDAWGRPPLFHAVAPFGGCERCTRRLLDAGANVNLRATTGESVLDALRAGVSSAAEHETANRIEALLVAAGFGATRGE